MTEDRFKCQCGYSTDLQILWDNHQKRCAADPAQSAPSAEPSCTVCGWKSADEYNAMAERTAQLERQIRDYENGINWMTNCTSCAGYLDKIYDLDQVQLAAMKTRAETAESALRDAKVQTIQECIKIATQRATQNRVHSLKFTAFDQKSMYERAVANAGEAERLADLLSALLTVAAQTPQPNK